MRTSPSVLVDAAHNPAGMAATVDAIKESFDFTRLIGVVGCVVGKDVAGILAPLEDMLRGARRHAEQLAARHAGRRTGRARRRHLRCRPGQVSPRLAEALEEAIELAEAGPDDALGGSGVLVTGSVVTAGEARTLLSGRRS